MWINMGKQRAKKCKHCRKFYIPSCILQFLCVSMDTEFRAAVFCQITLICVWVTDICIVTWKTKSKFDDFKIRSKSYNILRDEQDKR